MRDAGKVWKYGDDVNTDMIFPGRYTYIPMKENEFGKYALEDLDERFAAEVEPGDIIVAGKNWGCGSAREQAVKTLKIRGVQAIIAKSFARIYYRNCLNEGLAVITCPEAAELLNDGEQISIDFKEGVIIRENGDKIAFSPYPEYVKGLVECGGIIPYVQQRLKERETKGRME